MYGPDERLIVCNARYREIYGLDPRGHEARNPASRPARALDREGNDPGMTAEEFYEKRKAVVAGDPISTMQIHLKNGRVIEQTSRVTPDGGWVSAHEDVTERLPTSGRCASRTSCSTPRWKTWRTACACSTRTGA